MPENLQQSTHLGNATIPLDAKGAVELRVTPVCGSDGPDVTALDLRLYRKVPSDLAGGAYGQTPAGFRVPLRVVPQLVGSLLDLAKQAEKAR